MNLSALSLRAIQEFVTLSEIRNYARAADRLYTSQATLSRHIVNLELLLGQPLFRRTTRTVELTEFGVEFLPFAKSFMQTMEACNEALFSAQEPDENHIVVGVFSPLFYDKTIKAHLIKFCNDNPNVEVEIRQANEEELFEKLKSRECDLVLLREPENNTDSYQRLTIGASEPICLVLPKNHAFANMDNIVLNLLQDEHFIPPPSYNNTYKLFLKRCQEVGFKPKIRPCMSRDIAIGMARGGNGIPILTHVSAELAADPTVSVVKIYPPINLATNIIYPKLPRQPAAMVRFLSFFKNHYQEDQTPAEQ